MTMIEILVLALLYASRVPFLVPQNGSDKTMKSVTITEPRYMMKRSNTKRNTTGLFVCQGGEHRKQQECDQNKN